ncbi:MAG: hypothetical protein ACRDHU_14480 [Actinomycetota bacterium]
MTIFERWRRLAVAVVALAIAAGACEGGDGAGSAAAMSATPASGTPSPSSSSEFVRVGGAPARIEDQTIDDPTLLPYPFMSPTPPPTASALDGTYLRTMTLRDVGGARVGLPFRCLRCPPFRIDAGVSTLIFTRGAYYLHHQLSGFRTMGSFVVEGDRVTLFNDANCPQTPGVYAVDATPHGLRFRVIEDDCPFSGERALDLMVRPWTRVSACVRRIQNLWPGEVAC